MSDSKLPTVNPADLLAAIPLVMGTRHQNAFSTMMTTLKTAPDVDGTPAPALKSLNELGDSIDTPAAPTDQEPSPNVARPRKPGV